LRLPAVARFDVGQVEGKRIGGMLSALNVTGALRADAAREK